MKRYYPLISTLLLLSMFQPIMGQDSTALLIEQIESTLNYQDGTLEFDEGHFMLKVPDQLHFLDKIQADYVLTNLYGNQKDSLLIGLLKSTNKGVLSPDAWVISVSYHPIGFTSTEKQLPKGEKYWNDKQQIQFDSLNAIRKGLGYIPVNFGGFHVTPTYNADLSTLHWAKSILFPGDDQMTLNYTALIFGRQGYIKLNAVSALNESEEVNKSFMPLLNELKFQDGFQYKDHKENDQMSSELSLENLILGTKPESTQDNNDYSALRYVWIILISIGIILLLRFLYFKISK